MGGAVQENLGGALLGELEQKETMLDVDIY